MFEYAPIDSATGRRGPSNLWLARATPTGWGTPRRIGLGVNDPAAYDNFVWFSADGCSLRWTRGFTRFMEIGVEALLEAR